MRNIKTKSSKRRQRNPVVKIEVPVLRVNIKAGPKEYARAHAQTILAQMDKNNFGPATDEFYSPPQQGAGWNDDGGSNTGITTGNTGGNSGGGWENVLDTIGKIGDAGGKVLDVVDRIGGKRTAGVSTSSAGKSEGVNILAGLGESYIQGIVAKYRAGKSLSEFERRVAEAAIGLEGYAKTKAKQKAGEWIIDHGLEIGIGAAILILLIFMLKR